MPRKFCWISAEAIDSALYLSNSGWLEKLIRLLLSLGLLFLLCKRKTLLLTIICVNLYHRVQVLCFFWRWEDPVVTITGICLSSCSWNKDKDLILTCCLWVGIFFFLSSVLWVNLNLWPPLAAVGKSSLTPCLPPLLCKDEGWSSEEVGAGKLRKIFGPEEEEMRLKAWSQ